MRVPGFVRGSYQDQSLVAAGERCINQFPEQNPKTGRWGLYPAPGLPTFATLPKSPGRGIFEERGRLFAVFGDTLYEIDETGAATARGTVALDANPVSFATNGDGGDELLAATGTVGYILDLGTNVFSTEVTDVTQVGQLDGFFVALDAETSTLKISESLDGTTWDPTQIAQRTAAADLWRAMIVLEREIFLFGDKTGEVWYNAGISPFPFAQRRGSEFDTGIAAKSSLAKFGSTCAWLGKREAGGYGVYQMNGYTPEKISPTGLDWLIQTYADDDTVEDAVGWSYEREGHVFYVLHFPAVGKTHVYDAITREWHERGRWNTLTAQYDVYRALLHAFAFGKNLVCDPEGDKIYRLSSEVFTDVEGGVLRRERITPDLASENKRIFYTSFELDCDVGVGLADEAAQGYDPEVMLRYSNDGGQTWGSERSRKLGRRGAFSTPLPKWYGCGSGRKRRWRVAQTDPVPSRWYDAYVESEVGRF